MFESQQPTVRGLTAVDHARRAAGELHAVAELTAVRGPQEPALSYAQDLAEILAALSDLTTDLSLVLGHVDAAAADAAQHGRLVALDEDLGAEPVAAFGGLKHARALQTGIREARNYAGALAHEAAWAWSA